MCISKVKKGITWISEEAWRLNHLISLEFFYQSDNTCTFSLTWCGWSKITDMNKPDHSYDLNTFLFSVSFKMYSVHWMSKFVSNSSFCKYIAVMFTPTCYTYVIVFIHSYSIYYHSSVLLYCEYSNAKLRGGVRIKSSAAIPIFIYQSLSKL